MQLQAGQLGQQLLVGFRMRRVGVDALDRAHRHALGFVEVPTHSVHRAGSIT